jgi:hypothetical protein
MCSTSGISLVMRVLYFHRPIVSYGSLYCNINNRNSSHVQAKLCETIFAFVDSCVVSTSNFVSESDFSIFCS